MNQRLSRNLNIACCIIWLLSFILGIPAMTRNPSFYNAIMEMLRLLLSGMFGWLAYQNSKKV